MKEIWKTILAELSLKEDGGVEKSGKIRLLTETIEKNVIVIYWDEQHTG